MAIFGINSLDFREINPTKQWDHIDLWTNHWIFVHDEDYKRRREVELKHGRVRELQFGFGGWPRDFYMGGGLLGVSSQLESG